MIGFNEPIGAKIRVTHTSEGDYLEGDPKQRVVVSSPIHGGPKRFVWLVGYTVIRIGERVPEYSRGDPEDYSPAYLKDVKSVKVARVRFTPHGREFLALPEHCTLECDYYGD